MSINPVFRLLGFSDDSTVRRSSNNGSVRWPQGCCVEWEQKQTDCLVKKKRDKIKKPKKKTFWIWLEDFIFRY